MDKRAFIMSICVLAAFRWVGSSLFAADAPKAGAAWALNMNVLESCSCPVFCQCFFTGKPPAMSAMHKGHAMTQHVCRFNQAYVVNKGHAGSVRLDGAKFWFLGDAGDDFAKPKLDWAILTFDPSVLQEQRDALLGVLRHVRWYRPDRWNSYAISEDAPVEVSANSTGAHATLGGGSIAETKTTTMLGLRDKPVMMSNMEYFGFPRNSGFTLMPSDVVAYRLGDHAFEYKNTNGFLTTVDMDANDFPPPGPPPVPTEKSIPREGR